MRRRDRFMFSLWGVESACVWRWRCARVPFFFFCAELATPVESTRLELLRCSGYKWNLTRGLRMCTGENCRWQFCSLDVEFASDGFRSICVKFRIARLQRWRSAELWNNAPWSEESLCCSFTFALFSSEVTVPEFSLWFFNFRMKPVPWRSGQPLERLDQFR